MEKHITEIRRPEQSAAFKEITDHLYQVHLDKNADYSPANILGTGEIGTIVRIWDKVARLMNLYGFKIEIASSHYEAPQEPVVDESIEDTLTDLANYAIIQLILRQDKWGK